MYRSSGMGVFFKGGSMAVVLKCRAVENSHDWRGEGINGGGWGAVGSVNVDGLILVSMAVCKENVDRWWRWEEGWRVYCGGKVWEERGQTIVLLSSRYSGEQYANAYRWRCSSVFDCRRSTVIPRYVPGVPVYSRSFGVCEGTRH